MREAGVMKLFVSWSSKMETGIEKIDIQHKKLFEIAERLSEAKGGDTGILDQSIAETVEELLKYAEIHFETEELLMEEAGFEGYAEHKRIHRMFKEKAQAYHSRINERSDDIFLAMEIMNFMIDWIIDHISKTDQEYVESISGSMQG